MTRSHLSNFRPTPRAQGAWVGGWDALCARVPTATEWTFPWT